MTAQNTDISLFSVTDIVEKGICLNNHLSSAAFFSPLSLLFLTEKCKAVAWENRMIKF